MTLRFLICSITGLLLFARNTDGSKKQDFLPHEQSYPPRPQQLRLNADIVSLASQILEPFLISSSDSGVSLQNLPRQPIHLSFKDDSSINPTKLLNNQQIQKDLAFSRNQQTSPNSGNQDHRLRAPQTQSSVRQPFSESQERGFRLETVPLHQFYQNFSKDFPSSHWSYELRNHSAGSRKYHSPDNFSAFAATGDTRVNHSSGNRKYQSQDDFSAFAATGDTRVNHSSGNKKYQSPDDFSAFAATGDTRVNHSAGSRKYQSPDDFSTFAATGETRVNHSSGNRKYPSRDDFPAFAATGDTRVRKTLSVHSGQDTTVLQNAKPQTSRQSSRFRPLQPNFDATHADEKFISVSRRPSPSNQNINKNIERTPRMPHVRVQNDRQLSAPYYTANSHIRSNVAVHPGSSPASDSKFGPVPYRATHDSRSVQYYNVYPDDKDQSGRRFLVFRAPGLITTPRPSSAPFTVDSREKKIQRKPTLPSFEEASHEDIQSTKEKPHPTGPTMVVQRPNTPGIVIDVVTLHNMHNDNAEKAIKDLSIQPHSNTKYDDIVFDGTPAPYQDAKHSNHHYPSKQFEDPSHFTHETKVAAKHSNHHYTSEQFEDPSHFTHETKVAAEHSNHHYPSKQFEDPSHFTHETKVAAEHSNHHYTSKQFEDPSHFTHETTVKQMPPPSSLIPEYSPEFSHNVLPGPTTPLPPVTAAFTHERQQSHHQLESNPYGHISPFSNTLSSTKRPKVRAKPKPVSTSTLEKRKTQSISFLPEGGSFGSQNVPGQPGSDYPIFNEIPFTNFDCKEFQKPGFYADIEAGCQVFHNCDMGMKKHSFICPNGTIFHQQVFICDWWYNVRCDDSPDFFNLNEGLYLETSAGDEKQQKSENYKRNNKRVAS